MHLVQAVKTPSRLFREGPVLEPFPNVDERDFVGGFVV